MAGHSKWANIKHKKERADKKKGKLFSRLAKEIISAVKQGGADLKTNSKLRMIIQKAKIENLPNEIIERNIKKAGSINQKDFYEMTYELYGHGGVGIILDIMTDNKNRIASEIRIATNKCGGSIATPGAVSYNFERKGVIQVKKDQAIEEELFSVVTESGAEGFDEEGEFFIITTLPEDFIKVKEAIKEKKIKITEASVEMLPKIIISCNTEDKAANNKLIEWLENLNDLDAIYHNMDMTE